jgi:hypothetical protein
MRLILLTLLILLAAAAPASAAKPFFVGTGGDPGVAVDATGTAHVAWWVESEARAAPDVVHYCQVPRGARRCAGHLVLPAPGEPEITAADVQVLLPRPGAVLIVGPRVNGPIALFSSADGGATFATLAMADLGNIADAQYGPGDSLSLAPSQYGSYGQFGLDGSGLAWPVSFGGATEAMDPTVVLHEGRPVVLFGGVAGFKTFVWTGAGSPNDQAMWVPGPMMPYGAWEPSAASGPSGTFFAFVRREGGPVGTFVRRFKPERFGRARRITRETFLTPELVQWPRGTLTVLYEDDHVLYRRDSRKGRRWSRAKRLFTGNEADSVRAATGPRGGWLVWDGDTTPSSGSPIRMVRLPRR